MLVHVSTWRWARCASIKARTPRVQWADVCDDVWTLNPPSVAYSGHVSSFAVHWATHMSHHGNVCNTRMYNVDMLNPEISNSDLNRIIEGPNHDIIHQQLSTQVTPRVCSLQARLYHNLRCGGYHINSFTPAPKPHDQWIPVWQRTYDWCHGKTAKINGKQKGISLKYTINAKCF